VPGWCRWAGVSDGTSEISVVADGVLSKGGSLPWGGFCSGAAIVGRYTPLSLRQLEVAGLRAGVTGARNIHAGRGRKSSVKIIRQRPSRFVRTSRARRSWVARAGLVRSLVRIRQFLRWAKLCSTGARPTARTRLASFCPGSACGCGWGRSWCNHRVEEVVVQAAEAEVGQRAEAGGA